MTQIQISDCVSNCQNLNQTQIAQQQAVSSQILQAEAQLGGDSSNQEDSGSTGQAGAPGSSPIAITTTITQIQLGCLTECFGNTASDPATAATAQQILAELASILSPTVPPSPVPVPALEQSTTTQTSCQQQDGQTPTLSQVQNASQTSATIQAISAALGLTSIPEGVSEVVQAVSQIVQSSWQLQIGCLFYCADTQQVQQAQQSVTAITIVPGPGSTQPAGVILPIGTVPSPGSTSTAVTVVTQVIWQVQVGCLAWCYDSTQVQQATARSTVVVISEPVPVPTPPTPTPAPGPTAPTEPAALSVPTVAPTDQNPIPTPLPRLMFPDEVGWPLLTVAWARTGPAPAIRLISTAAPVDPPAPLELQQAPRSMVYLVISPKRSTVRRAPRRYQPAVRPSSGNAAPAVRALSGNPAPVAVVEDRVSHDGAGDSPLGLVLGLILLASASSYAIRRVRAGTGSER